MKRKVTVAMLYFDDLGRAEGSVLGPRPGNGAVLHECSAEADFDGLPGNELASREAIQRKLNEGAPAPVETFVGQVPKSTGRPRKHAMRTSLYRLR